jgi:hypothetical protein
MNEEKKTRVKCGHDEPRSFNSFIDPEGPRPDGGAIQVGDRGR